MSGVQRYVGAGSSVTGSDLTSSRARVLVVDDHPPNLVAVAAILEPLGLELVTATSGQEALRHLLQQEFGLILLDVHMPGMDGFETATLIKGPERTRHIPIIFLTAVDRDAVHIFSGYRHGAVDYLLKPIEPELLRAKVTVFVDLHLQNQLIKRQAAQLVENAALYEDERRARAAAEAGTRAREAVLAVVSHDLRNPLAAISMGAETMLAAMPASDDYAKLRKTATMVQRIAVQTAELLDDLLEVSRIEAGGLVLERKPVSVKTLIGNALDVFQPLAAQRHQRLEADTEVPDLLVSCDAHRLSQVFSNLLGNALKFTGEGGSITIRAERHDGVARFAVIDSGAGIPAAQLPHVFDRYWQARTSGRAGVGLGLAIAKGIVEAHGGEIRVDASSAAGTMFVFTIPLA